jgi:2-polyprenyl-6-methoxyphenol hydroxylase-like FAD-dependent oxidoreductase
MARHAEIAGGGIGGLTIGMMLARTGWTVRIHEQAPEIREIGSGVFLRNNSLEVLDEYGLFQGLRATGSELTRQLTINRHGKIMEERSLDGQSRVWVLPRQALVESLRDAALSSGAEIVTRSTAAEADPDGALVLANGRRLPADLVIGADGIHSRIRYRLGIGGQSRVLPTTINRYLCPITDLPNEPVHKEYWGPNRRIGVAPCGAGWTYVYQVCRSKDKVGVTIPNDVEAWSRSLPLLRHAFEVFARTEAIQHEYQEVRCPTWFKGRVALLGDAAHGMPPTLGQGAGLAIMNARGLVAALEEEKDVTAALPKWEQSIRFITDRTQAWATRFDVFANRWPDALWFLRWPVVWGFRYFPIFNDRMRIAEKGLANTPLGRPIGAPLASLDANRT